jgi:hypothetical protein
MRSGWGIICIITALGCSAEPVQAQGAGDAPGAPAGVTAAPTANAPLDPNIDLREKLAKIRQDNDDLAGRLKELQLLIDLNVCDPATKSKIETLLLQASLAPQTKGEATPGQVEQ